MHTHVQTFRAKLHRKRKVVGIWWGNNMGSDYLSSVKFNCQLRLLAVPFWIVERVRSQRGETGVSRKNYQLDYS